MITENDTVTAGSVGVALRATFRKPNGAPIPPDGLDVRQLVLVQPDGTQLARTGTPGMMEDGRTPCLEYKTAAGELDAVGEYQAIWRVGSGGSRIPTTTTRFYAVRPGPAEFPEPAQ